MARRFRSTRASGCLSVSLSGLIGHWSNIMTGRLDLICHRPMTALHVSQFTKRREREVDRKEGRQKTVRGGGIVCETDTERCILMVLMCVSLGT